VNVVAKASKKKINSAKAPKTSSQGKSLPKPGLKSKLPAKPRSAKVIAKKSAVGKPASVKTSKASIVGQKAKGLANKSAKSTNKKAASATSKVVTQKTNGKPAVSASRPKENSRPLVPKVTAKGESKKTSTVVASSVKSNGSKIAHGKAQVATKPVNKPSPKKKAPVKAPVKPPEPPTNPAVLKKIRELQSEREAIKDISFRPSLVKPPGANEPIWEKEPTKDRIALLVRDSYWLHATWDITRRAVERARAAMAEHWHTAQPTLRFLRLDNSSTTNTSETIERDIPIHGGLRNWYIDIGGQAAGFQALVGYSGAGGRFHTIAESNIVHTPGAASGEAVDQHWSDMGGDFEHIYAMSGGYDSEQDSSELKEMLEDRLHRPVGAPAFAQFGAGAETPFRRRGGFHFEMDVELVAFGSTVPDGYLTLSGEPVKLRPDGTFVVRLPFPDRRQVLPAMATSRDGSQQRTIVIAVERNTKIMEPFAKEIDEGP
jgi:uncharacterized protein